MTELKGKAYVAYRAAHKVFQKVAGGRSYLRLVALTPGMIDLDEAEILHDLASEVSDGVIIEVGAYRGRSAVALAAGVADSGRETPIFAIDPHEEFVGALGGNFSALDRAAFYRAMLRSKAWRHVRLINLSSEVVAPGWNRLVGLLWLDGDHTYDGVRRDFGCWSPHLIPGAAVVFDDSTNRKLGPAQLIDELTEEGVLSTRRIVGKITICRFAGTDHVTRV
jgi:Methyltransferase domain